MRTQQFACCSFRGPGFDFQHPHNPSLIPVPGDPVPSSGLRVPGTNAVLSIHGAKGLIYMK